MLDRLRICIPFQPQFLQISNSFDDHGQSIDYVDLKALSQFSGIRLSARDVEFDINTQSYEISGLSHPYESLPSSYTGLAFKVYQGARLSSAHVEIKASPAKLLQGHNVFGPTDIALCAMEMFYCLATALPEIVDFCDISRSYVADMDCTFSASVGSENNAKQVISALKNVSNGHMRASVKSQEHETTCYFNVGSRHADKKAYAKFPELLNQIKDAQSAVKRDPFKQDLLDILTDTRLHDFSKPLVRFEGRAKSRLFARLKIPQNLFSTYSPIDGEKRLGLIDYQRQFEASGQNLIYTVWKEMFNPLFEAFEGEDMNVFDDEEVLNKLKKVYSTVTPKGNISYSKALRAFGFYRRLSSEGYQSVKDTMPPRSFYDNLKLLTNAGLSKAQLQNIYDFHQSNNIVPLLRIVNVDFSNQFPDWYVEPQSRFKNVTSIFAA